MKRLERFLSATARQMRIMPAAARDDELRELRGHLEQRAEDYADAGMSDDAAQMRALEGLGSPRKLGASLCDAWEGIPFSWWRLAAALVGVTAVWGVGIIVVVLALVAISLNSEVALLPEIVPLLCGFYMALPLGCGVLFSHWLGRHGWLVSTLYFAVCRLNLTYPSPQSTFAPPANFVELTNAAWFPYILVVLAFVGAWTGQSWRMKKRHQLALAGTRPLAPSRFLVVPLNLDWWRNAVLLAVVGGALYAGRVWTRFHPQTPDATLRNYLIIKRQANPGDLEPPRLLATRELPAQTPAEISGQQKRIWFKAELRMTPQYAARRVAYLKQLLNSPKQERPFEDETLRRSLARLQHNRQIIQGTATIVKTPKGWQVDEQSVSPLGAWAYDLAYER